MDYKIAAIVFIIFFTGFFLRLETVHLPHLNETEKAKFTDDNRLPYMYDPDCYYNYRLTKNFIENGHLGDSINDGKSWDSLSYYPPGLPVGYPLLAWVASIFYFIMHALMGMDLLESCFWLPTIIGPLPGIVMFFFVRRYSGDLAGFLGGILLTTAPIYFSRTVPGFFDTDAFNVLMPLIIIFSFTRAVESAKSDYKIPLLSSIVSLALFSITWTGWQFILYIIVISSIIYASISKLRGLDCSQPMKVIGFFILFSLVAVFIIGGLDSIIHIANLEFLPAFFFRYFGPATKWPNIFESVGELAKPSITEFVFGIGPMNIGLGLIGAIMIPRILLDEDIREKHLPLFNPFTFTLMFVWLLIGLAAFYAAVRFAIFAAIPLAFLSGILVGILSSYLNNPRLNKLKIGGVPLRGIFVALVTLLLFITPVIQTGNVHMIPLIDDDIASAASWIKNETPKDTIIISEWSYGRYIATATERPVLIEGGSQNTPRAYWIYRAFATDNETLSLSIFKMFTASGDNGIETLENHTKDVNLTAAILNDILGVDKKTAKRILLEKYHMDPLFTDKLLDYTHPATRKSFIILTDDGMLNIGKWVYYYGLWDFNKSWGYKPLYIIGYSNDQGVSRRYSENVSFDSKGYNASWNGKKPHKIILKYKDSTKSIVKDASSPFSLIFLMDKNEVLIVDRKLENSLLIKLLVTRNETMHFKPIYNHGSVTIWGVK